MVVEDEPWQRLTRSLSTASGELSYCFVVTVIIRSMYET